MATARFALCFYSCQYSLLGSTAYIMFSILLCLNLTSALPKKCGNNCHAFAPSCDCTRHVFGTAQAVSGAWMFKCSTFCLTGFFVLVFFTFLFYFIFLYTCLSEFVNVKWDVNSPRYKFHKYLRFSMSDAQLVIHSSVKLIFWVLCALFPRVHTHFKIYSFK